jgi:hypothetical protein
VALEQAVAGGSDHDQPGPVFRRRVDQPRRVRFGAADVEPRLQSLGHEGKALPFGGEQFLFYGAERLPLPVQGNVRRVPAHHVDQVKVGVLGTAQGRGQCDGVGAAVIGGVANYVSHVKPLIGVGQMPASLPGSRATSAGLRSCSGSTDSS